MSRSKAVVRCFNHCLRNLFESLSNFCIKTPEKNIRNLQNSIESPNLKAIISHLRNELSDRDEQILALTNRVDDLERRVLECEKYSSKDWYILTNLSLQNSNVPLADQVSFSRNTWTIQPIQAILKHAMISENGSMCFASKYFCKTRNLVKKIKPLEENRGWQVK